MKKKIAILISGAIVVVLIVLRSSGWSAQPTQLPVSTKEVTGLTTPVAQISVTLILDTGDRITTYSGILAKTPFEALTDVVKKEKLSLETKQYDFGVFVKKIGTYESGNTNAWIVSVNGQSLTTAADKTQIKNGDVVEWVYSPIK
jgi:hypothetical protein